jgi:hypothetical protein
MQDARAFVREDCSVAAAGLKMMRFDDSRIVPKRRSDAAASRWVTTGCHEQVASGNVRLEGFYRAGRTLDLPDRSATVAWGGGVSNYSTDDFPGGGGTESSDKESSVVGEDVGAERCVVEVGGLKEPNGQNQNGHGVDE